jgi:KipI family sensor histidine kinase inhibitor
MAHAARSHHVRRVLPCGDRGVLVETTDTESVPALLRAVDAAPMAGLVEVVAGAATVLLRFDPFTVSEQRVREYAEALEPLPAGAADVITVVVPVVYDGRDLHDVAEAAGLSRDEVVARHTAPAYEVAFCGFAPGFAYLRGLDPALVVPRLDTPRTRVPAGAVAVADVWTGVYPRESPGGWRLLGRTDLVLWDSGNPEPALLAAGTIVRFEVAR